MRVFRRRIPDLRRLVGSNVTAWAGSTCDHEDGGSRRIAGGNPGAGCRTYGEFLDASVVSRLGTAARYRGGRPLARAAEMRKDALDDARRAPGAAARTDRGMGFRERRLRGCPPISRRAVLRGSSSSWRRNFAD